MLQIPPPRAAATTVPRHLVELIRFGEIAKNSLFYASSLDAQSNHHEAENDPQSNLACFVIRASAAAASYFSGDSQDSAKEDLQNCRTEFLAEPYSHLPYLPWRHVLWCFRTWPSRPHVETRFKRALSLANFSGARSRLGG